MRKRLLFQIGLILVNLIIYMFFLKIETAILLVISIIMHEYSHILMAKYLKLKTAGFYMLPFLGAFAIINDKYTTYNQKIYVSLAGPIGGSLLGFITIIIYYITGNYFFGAATMWVFYFSLFNLAPISLLDGGQVLDSIAYSFNETLGFIISIVSTVVGVVILYFFNSFIAGFIAVFGGLQIYLNYKDWRLNQALLKLKAENLIKERPKALTYKEIAYTLILTIMFATSLYLLMIVLMHDSISIEPLFKK